MTARRARRFVGCAASLHRLGRSPKVRIVRLDWTPEELLADPEFSSRLRRNGTLFHGGLDANGAYLPPRSRNRSEAIAAWTARLRDEGHPTTVVDASRLPVGFFPTVEQAKLLLRHGARDAMTRILTMIGITEGFGNDGIRALPRPELQPFFRESIDGTCLAHLYRGLLEAHGNDEAGRGDEIGHDGMWFAIRDAALADPVVTPDMFENLPVAPPPGYTGPARPGPDAMGPGVMVNLLFPSLDPVFEILLTALAQILVIELLAYSTFDWAREVLGDPECSAEPEWAPRMIGYIREDENIHVAYLQCALAEARARTIIGTNGREFPGARVVDAIVDKIAGFQTGDRRERILAHRMRQIRHELGKRSDGDRMLEEFERLGPVPG